MKRARPSGVVRTATQKRAFPLISIIEYPLTHSLTHSLTLIEKRLSIVYTPDPPAASTTLSLFSLVLPSTFSLCLFLCSGGKPLQH